MERFTVLFRRARSWWSGRSRDVPASRDRVRTEAARLVAGEISEREFLGWVHEHVGHDGYDDLTELVELDDEYDPVVFPEEDRWFREAPEAEAIRGRVRAAARRLLAEG